VPVSSWAPVLEPGSIPGDGRMLWRVSGFRISVVGIRSGLYGSVYELTKRL
jgi:hypothetical protein